MEICLKFNQLPEEVTTTANGWKEFLVLANGREVFISLRPKHFNKLLEAQKTWPEWIAKIVGKVGAKTEKGFVLDQVNPQVFERKAPVNAPVAVIEEVKPLNDETTLKEENIKQIQKGLDPYLSLGKYPPYYLIQQLCKPYNLTPEATRKVVSNLQARNKITRETGFAIEKKYFELIETWSWSLNSLYKQISFDLGITFPAVATWLGFIHNSNKYLRQAQDVTKEIADKIIVIYKEYLAGDKPPEIGLHKLIAREIEESITYDQVHKLILSYRWRVRSETFSARKFENFKANLNKDTDEALASEVNSVSDAAINQDADEALASEVNSVSETNLNQDTNEVLASEVSPATDVV